MKYIILTSFLLSLGACDFHSLDSPAQEACENIAINRLKHPGSYDYISLSEEKWPEGEVSIQIAFKAWNDFKVPMEHSIACRYQGADPHDLLSVKWNGRPIRIQELDDIREKHK